MTIGQRIKRAREGAGLGKAEMARLLGRSPSVVTQWESESTKALKAENLIGVARLTGVRPEWLESGEGPMRSESGQPGVTSGEMGRYVGNITDKAPSLVRVPLISSTEAGSWNEVDDWTPSEGRDWAWTTAGVGREAFAMKVIGDSMEPKIPSGSTVIVDPAKRYGHGSIVIARRPQDRQATMKQLWYDGDQAMLRPLNERYPMMEMPAGTKIIGVVVKVEIDI